MKKLSLKILGIIIIGIVVLQGTVFATSNNFTMSNKAPLTPILFNCNSNSEISLSLLALLQFSKVEFAIFNKYSMNLNKNNKN